MNTSKILLVNEQVKVVDIFDNPNTTTGGFKPEKNGSCSCQNHNHSNNEIDIVMDNYVSAKVVDENDKPLVTANVVNLSNKKGTITNDAGVFSLSADLNEPIKISFVGYKEFTVVASKLPSVVKLIPDDTLEDVVINSKKPTNWGLWLAGGLVLLYGYSRTQQPKAKAKARVVNG